MLSETIMRIYYKFDSKAACFDLVMLVQYFSVSKYKIKNRVKANDFKTSKCCRMFQLFPTETGRFMKVHQTEPSLYDFKL